MVRLEDATGKAVEKQVVPCAAATGWPGVVGSRGFRVFFRMLDVFPGLKSRLVSWEPLAVARYYVLPPRGFGSFVWMLTYRVTWRSAKRSFDEGITVYNFA